AAATGPAGWSGGEAGAFRTLDLPPGASSADILSAYLKLRRTLRRGSPALASLDCEAERRATAAEVEEAYRSLSRNVSMAAPRPDRAPVTRVETPVVDDKARAVAPAARAARPFLPSFLSRRPRPARAASL